MSYSKPSSNFYRSGEDWFCNFYQAPTTNIQVKRDGYPTDIIDGKPLVVFNFIYGAMETIRRCNGATINYVVATITIYADNASDLSLITNDIAAATPNINTKLETTDGTIIVSTVNQPSGIHDSGGMVYTTLNTTLEFLAN